jgi:fatty-acyl-CoA synthase
MFVPMLVTDFARRAEKQYGSKTGVVDGDKRFTYAQYVERTMRLSSALLEIGVERGDRVAFIDYNTHRLLEAFYGVPRIGAILLFINIRLSPDDIAFILNDSGASCVVINEGLAELVLPVKAKLETVKRFVVMRDEAGESSLPGAPEYEDLLQRASTTLPKVDLDENDPAEMCYTSGTTGGSKGMLLTHRMLYFNAINMAMAAQVDDHSTFLHSIPLFHVNGWGTPHFLTAAGGKHVMLKEFRPEDVCRAIEQERVTNIFMVPTMANTLVNYEHLGDHDLSSLEQVAIGGAPLSSPLFRLIEEKLGCEVYAGYGLTETSPGLTMSRAKHHLSHLSGDERVDMLRAAGYADPLVEVRVVREDGEDVRPDGTEAGEIIARGNNVIDGYWNRPEETARTIIDGWFHTGDMATIDVDGYIRIVDRTKDIIISGGENISTPEVENVVAGHPSVLECAVVAAPHDKWGETPAALVVLREGHSLTSDELTAYCKTHLAGFKVPHVIEFMDSLPKGGTGKILKRELRERFWKGHKARVA